MTSGEIRRKFLAFFVDRAHRIVPSSSFVPENDPTLLFVNAGMNQFKDVLLGLKKQGYVRACSAQKCLRAGGKHNDLEQVGRTRRHHTFFEMLGNFSFGPSSLDKADAPDMRRGYFKREVIPWAWELVTKEFGLPLNRLWVTVFREDNEAFEIWRKDIGVAEERILRCDEKDNFWAMGETGPCGPCSEIHYDLGPEGSDLGHPQCNFPCPEDCGRYMEIWNLVFMQFNRSEGGALEPLPSPSIDTGMGLERMATVLQGKISNFDTDQFAPIIEQAADLASIEYGGDAEKDISLRIIADHARAAAFLVPDGVLPSNEGRGYVLRKILRRAIRHGRMLGLEDPFLFKLAASVAHQMKDAYPEVMESEQQMASLVKGEEVRFAHTFAVALKKLDEAVRVLPKQYPGLELQEWPDGSCGVKQPANQSRSGSSEVPVLPGKAAFKLYDTYGLPLDLLQDEGNLRGFAVDTAGFERELNCQRERARVSWKGKSTAEAPLVWQEISQNYGPTEFLGYENTEEKFCIPTLIPEPGKVSVSLEAGVEAEIVLDRTPFYAEAGGQVGDTGVLLEVSCRRIVAEVIGTYSPIQGLTVHRVRTRARISSKDNAQLGARVDRERRDHTRRNHTATHLLQAALQQTLGTHVKQSGSLVAPDRLRFDFTHYTRLEPAELRDIEDLVNQHIRLNQPVAIEQMDLESAVRSGAMALFGEKYSEQVRVVSVSDFSKELCGGSHVRRTGDIGLFKITSEASSAAGIRRIEALTGDGVLRYLRRAENTLGRISYTLRVKAEEIVPTVERLAESEKQLRKQLEAVKAQSLTAKTGDLVRNARTVKGVQVVAARVPDPDRAAMRQLVDCLRSTVPSSVIVIGASGKGKVALVTAVSRDLTDRLDAGKIAKQVAGIVDGKGGGRKDLAEAGGKLPEKLDESIDAVYGIVEGML